MLDPKQGDKFTLTRSLGVEPGAIPAGAEVEVVDVVQGEAPGVGGSGDEPRLLLSYTFPATVVDENGAPGEGVSSRTFSLTPAELSPLVEADNGG